MQILGIGIAMLLIELGWRVTTMPGKPLVLVSGDEIVDPFTAAKNCAEGGASAEQWKARRAVIGISGRRLGQAATQGSKS